MASSALPTSPQCKSAPSRNRYEAGTAHECYGLIGGLSSSTSTGLMSAYNVFTPFLRDLIALLAGASPKNRR